MDENVQQCLQLVWGVIRSTVTWEIISYGYSGIWHLLSMGHAPLRYCTYPICGTLSVDFKWGKCSPYCVGTVYLGMTKMEVSSDHQSFLHAREKKVSF